MRAERTTTSPSPCCSVRLGGAPPALACSQARLTPEARGTSSASAPSSTRSPEYSEPMREVARSIERVRNADVNVAIPWARAAAGRSSARAIPSERWTGNGPFVALNCASIPHSIQESELFGHEKGSFTGASTTHRGKFEQASGGTLFLDEVGEMAPATQAGLLRVLQGGHRPHRRRPDIPWTPASSPHRDRRGSARRRREDLRCAIRLPITTPLRDRADDRALVAELLAERIAPAIARSAS